ncbi:hypothetical protein KJ830_00585 [bacterium]|nr:hypothetical protein [bacterium]MBU4509522.1 hypothetical protein [bacterium]
MKNLNKLKILIIWLILLTITCFFLVGFDKSESNSEAENEETYNIDDSEKTVEELNTQFEELNTQMEEYLKDLELDHLKSQEDLKSLQKEGQYLDIFIYIAIILAGATLAYAILSLKYPRSETKEKKFFFNTLLSGLKSGSIKTTDDLINIYKGIATFGPEDKKYRLGLNKWLREFLAGLISKSLDDSLEYKEIIDFKNKISKFIKENEKISPYSDLQEIERNIFQDILSYIKNSDVGSINQKLKELSSIIQTRKYETDRSKKINKYSVPIAITGLVLTIIFGLVAIFKY